MSNSTAGDPLLSFADRLTASLHDGTFVRLVLASPRQPQSDLQRILGRAVHIQGNLRLSLTERYPKRDVTRNLPLAEVDPWIRHILSASFRSALLCTVDRDWQFSATAKGKGRIVAHEPSCRELPSRAHDRKPADLLGAEAQPWLHALGITDPAGKVRPSMAHKHHQVRRYVEVLSHLVRDAGYAAGQTITVADMGCGKAYLTFAAWHLFRRLGIPAHVIGIEARPELVESNTAAARALGAEGLDFQAGTIREVVLPPLDALIALHACNTATDDALLRGIALGARLLLVAPCCHQQVRPQLKHPAPLRAALRHGILAERMAEWLTDALRALSLEWAGFDTKVFEFVPSEHTPKNLMISAVRHQSPFSTPAARQQILDLKAFFGLHEHALDQLLAPPDRHNPGPTLS